MVFKKKIFRKKRKKTIIKFTNNASVKVNFKRYSRIKKSYQNKLKLNHHLLQLFDNANKRIEQKRKKLLFKQTQLVDFFNYLVIKPEFKINILLWRLNFFQTPYAAQQSINNKEILLNGKSIKSNVFLKKGDVLTLPFSSFSNLFAFRKTLKNHSLSNFFNTFLEVDHYTKTIVMIKSFNSLNSSDFSLLNRYFFDLKYF